MIQLLAFVVIYPAVAFGALLILACMVCWQMMPHDRKRIEWLLVASLLVIPLNQIAELTTLAMSRLRPLKYDQFVYRLDGFWGQPSFILGRLVEHHIALKVLVSLTYGFLPLIIVAVFGVYLWRRSEAESLTVVRTFSLNLVGGLPIYLLFPVCGPQFAFPRFPFEAPSILHPHMLAINAAPNGVPSVHTSSALLILWFLWGWPLGRIFGLGFLGLTVLATLGSGQHYLFDLLCAIPYTMIVYRITRPAQVAVEECELQNT